jgi:hypothetical protein
MLNLSTRNDVKQREATCGYTKGVDGINTLVPHAERKKT